MKLHTFIEAFSMIHEARELLYPDSYRKIVRKKPKTEKDKRKMIKKSKRRNR